MSDMQLKSMARNLKILHASLCIGLIIFIIVAYSQKGSFDASMNGNVFIYVVPILAMLGYFGSKWIYQNLIRNIPESEPLPKKLQRYYAASLLKYALIEVVAIVAIFGYYSTGNAMHLVIAICLIVYLILQRPQLHIIKQEVPLNLQEEKEFDTLNL